MEPFDYRKYTWIAGMVALMFIAFAALGSGLNDLHTLRYPNGQQATISVSGEGEVTAVPDIATVNFTVRESAKTVPAAQKLVEDKITQALAAMNALDVDKKDTKTISYTVNPKYETQPGLCMNGYCPGGKTQIVGYEVAQTIEVKIRKIDSAGDALGALGGINITEISGPNYTVDDMDKVQAQAKAKAIAEAREKALATAKSLGVHLGEIVQYSEDNGGYYPVMMRADTMAYGKAGAEAQGVSLPEGESVIKARVTISYSIE